MTNQDSMHFDTVVAGLVADLRGALSTVPDDADSLLRLAASGVSPGQARSITREEYDALYAIARTLCNKGDFDSALPIALQLALHNPMDARFPFIAGTCLQRKKLTVRAAEMFALALAVDANHAAAMYRQGECLQAQGEREQAMRAFEATVEIARGADDLRRLHDAAAARLRRLRDKLPV
jgi:tetratricopeptide (TPR) repeat protein